MGNNRISMVHSVTEPQLIGFGDELPEDYVFHRKPLAHQLRIFNRFKNEKIIALFMEQRTMKTKIILDIFLRHYLLDECQVLLIMAFPSGVHKVWSDELVKEYAPEILEQCKIIVWDSRKTKLLSWQIMQNAALNHKDGPIIVLMNCEAILSDNTAKFVAKLLARYKAMVVADESSWAASWNKRTQRLLAIGRWTNGVKAILDGTPTSEGPQEVFWPTQFLKEGLLGFDSINVFRARHFKYETESVDVIDEATGALSKVEQRKISKNWKTKAEYTQVIGYQNLSELNNKLLTFGERLLRSDISDAPPKIYQTDYFTMTDKQQAVYRRLRDEYIAEVSSGDIPVAHVLARMTWMQMISRNYIPPQKIGIPCPACDGQGEEGCEQCEGLGIVVDMTKLERIDTKNPAIEAVLSRARTATTPMVVWARFKQDVDDVAEAAKDAGLRVGRFHGNIPDSVREQSYQDFRAGKLDIIAAITMSGLSRGRDLTIAKLMLYYSHWHGLRPREQSEDRAEAVLGTESTFIVDLAAEATNDANIIKALIAKKSISAAIMGDGPVRWLQ